MADTTTTTGKKIRVNGNLKERVSTNGKDKKKYYRMMLNWTNEDGTQGRTSRTTGLLVKRGNKQDAEDMLEEFKKEQAELLNSQPIQQVQPVKAAAGDMLFADFMERWLEVRRREVRDTTFGSYQTNVVKIIVPYFRNLGTLLCDITEDEINEFYEVQLARGITKMTVTKYHANISHALKYAVKKKLISSSEAIMACVDRPKPDKFVGKFLKPSEIVRLFDAVKGDKLELGVILGAYYGLRRSEIVGLRWEAIDFEANKMTIEHTVGETNIDGKRVITEEDLTKNKSSWRSLPLVPVLRAKLLAIRAEQDNFRKLCGRSYNKVEGRYIYTDPLGNRIKPGYLTHAFPMFVVKHGFDRMRFHDLRHSCASLLLANGVPLKQIQDWLGHSTFSTTADIYAHLDISSKLATAEAATWLNKTAFAQEFNGETE